MLSYNENMDTIMKQEHIFVDATRIKEPDSQPGISDGFLLPVVKHEQVIDCVKEEKMTYDIPSAHNAYYDEKLCDNSAWVDNAIGPRKQEENICYNMASKRKVLLKSDGIAVVLEVMKFCRKEQVAGALLIPVSKLMKRVAAMTGISERTLGRLKKRGNQLDDEGNKVKLRTPGKHRPRAPLYFDDFTKCALRSLVLSFYGTRKEIPTVMKVRAAVERELDINCSRETIRRVLKKIGFRFKKYRNRRVILCEKEQIANWRARYIRRIVGNEKAANPKPVIFLGETWIQPDYTVAQLKDKNTGIFKSDSAGQRHIIVHAGSKVGFFPGAYLTFLVKSKTGDYHVEMNAENFKKWAQEMLIPNLPENSLVVMDTAPYHSVVTNKSPTTAWKKEKIQEWLQDHGISYLEEFNKRELLALVKRNKPDKEFEIDGILRAAGHEVVRLPPYHCDLNPIEYIWNIAKRRVAEKNIDQSVSKISELTSVAIASVTPEDWLQCCLKVHDVIEDYIVKDNLYDLNEEAVIAMLEDSSSEDSDENEVDEDDDGDLS